VLGSLGRHDIPVRAIVQGASGRSVSCLVDGAQQSRAINVIHRGVFDERRLLALVVVGVGTVGGELLRQIRDRRPFLLEQGFDTKIVAIANSSRFVVNRDGIDLERWQTILEASDRQMDAGLLAREVAALDFANAALVDCTAAQSIVDVYPEFIKANLHIITPNKRANVLPWRQYAHLRRLLTTRHRHFLYATNVGAGLPVIATLRDLVASGDVIRRIEGVFSGTLGYLFSTFDGAVPFSTLVRDAHRLGYTEADPREDLSGQDVARKLLILARQIGLKMELDDVDLESLLPSSLAAGPFCDEFFSRYAECDGGMVQRLASARARGAVLRYVGTLEGGRARAELREYPRDHRFASTIGSDNVIAFTTDRYARTPLVVQGPGAGADVTAMGIFSDIFKLLNYLPH
jgi:aspartokinase/homoserine dehydrogenase 1